MLPNGKTEIADHDEVGKALDVLDRLAVGDGGWSALHRDPEDGRLWELTFPQSHLHGGGPSLLRVMSEDEAAAKYGEVATTADLPGPDEDANTQ